MGLTGGIADVGSLYDALMAMQKGRVTDEVLTEYSRVRSQRWRDVIDPMSRRNFGLIWDPGTFNLASQRAPARKRGAELDTRSGLRERCEF